MARGFRKIGGGIDRPPLWAAIVMVLGVAWLVVGGVLLPARKQPAYQSHPAAATTTQPTAAFLGDSYTVGVGSTSGSSSYVPATASGMGWRAATFAQGGTGYTTAGPTAGDAAYLDRVPAVVAAHPDIVIVQGGSNDYAASPASLTAAAGKVYAALHAGLPNAKIVVVGPVMAPNSDRTLMPKVAAGLRDAASAAGVPFVDPIAGGWLQPTTGLFAADGYHPNDKGYAQITARLLSALRNLNLG